MVFRVEDIEEVVCRVGATATEVIVVRGASRASGVGVLAVVRHFCKLGCCGGEGDEMVEGMLSSGR